MLSPKVCKARLVPFCSEGYCNCDPVLNSVDCYYHELKSIPHFNHEVQESALALYLQGNLLSNQTLNKPEWKSLLNINLKDNPLDCNYVRILEND